jgi:hypothetical protein
VRAAEHLPDLGGFNFLFERFDGTLQVGADILALLRPLQQHFEIVEFRDDGIAEVDFLGQPLAALQRFLGVSLIRPEVGRGDARLYRVEFVRRIGGVKDSSAGLWRVSPSLRSV